MNSTVTVSRTRSLTYMALSVALIAVCAWISIPTTVPFTMQTFGIFAILGLLGGRRGTLAILCYLLAGLVGLPVFSGFRGGVGMLMGNTGGYLVGFLVTGLCYWLITRLFGASRLSMPIAMGAGLLLLYLFGSLWFMMLYTAGTGAIGFISVLSLCVFPFLLPDLLKIALALLLVRRLKPHLHL